MRAVVEGCDVENYIFFKFPHHSRLAQPYASNAGHVKEPLWFIHTRRSGLRIPQWTASTQR